WGSYRVGCMRHPGRSCPYDVPSGWGFSVERGVDLGKGNGAGQTVKGPRPRDLSGGFEEPGPCRPRQCTTDADPAAPRPGELGDRREVTAHQHVDRLGSDRVDYRRDFGPAPDARRVQALGAGLGIGCEAADRFGEVRTTHDEPL